MDLQDLNELRSVEDLLDYQKTVVSRMADLNSEYDGLPFPSEARDLFATLKEQDDEINARVAELKARQRAIEETGSRSGNREALSFNTARPGVSRGDDIYDLSSVRLGFDGGSRELHDRARRSIDTSNFAPDRSAVLRDGTKETAEDIKERVSALLDRHSENTEVARRILLTGSPTYKRAFAKQVSGRGHSLSREEQDVLSRAASLTTTAGGYAVPYVLDPTVILTNNGAINPVRGIANVIQITGNDWRGVSSAGITASYDAEAAEVSDDTPTLAQPAANVEMARAFVPFSIEIGDDWGSFQSEMTRLFSDAKDILESDKFLKGLGHGSTQPEGLLVGANNGTVVTATASVVAVADLYSVENALAARWRARASWTAGKAFYQKVRQFDTGGGASLWTQLRFGYPGDLVGYPAYEWSDYSSAVTTPTSTVATLGDFNQFMIIDRIGMSVEVIPHMFHTSNNLPSGQRGLFAYWRNTSDVTVAAAFRHVRIS